MAETSRHGWDWNDNNNHYNHQNNMDSSTIALIVSLSIGGFIFMCVCCCCLVKRRRQIGHVTRAPNPNTVTVPANVVLQNNIAPRAPVLPNYQSGIIQQTGANGDCYMVPFTALPANFNYSSPDVEVRANHVLIKDLRLLEDQNTSNYHQLPPPYTATIECQTQSPYNPNYINYRY